MDKVKLDDIELMSLIVAGACHDHEHPGFNNLYLVENRDPIALRYNGKISEYFYINFIDQSVLENHHIASSFEVMQEEKNNILSGFSKDEFKKIRNIMIGCVLGTDMSKHFAELGKFKTRVQAEDFEPTGQDKEMTLHMLFHLADISNQTKPFALT